MPRATAKARDQLDARLGDQGRVSTDARTGGVKWLAATDTAVTGARSGDAANVALDYVRANQAAIGLDEDDLDALELAARYTDVNGVTHITWAQTDEGLESYDTTLSVNLGPNNEILNVTGSPVHDLSVASAVPGIGALEALRVAKLEVGGEMTPPNADRRPGAERATTFANGDAPSS